MPIAQNQMEKDIEKEIEAFCWLVSWDNPNIVLLDSLYNPGIGYFKQTST